MAFVASFFVFHDGEMRMNHGKNHFYPRMGFSMLRFRATKFIIALNVACLSLTFAGCGPRSEVIKDKVMDQINTMIGKTEIKEKKVETMMADIEKAFPPLTEGKIKAKVEAGQLEKRIVEIEEKIADAEASLKTLQGYLTTGEPVQLAGKTYSTADLASQAGKVIQAHKSLTADLTAMKAAKSQLEQSATELEERLETGRQQLATLKAQHKQIQGYLVSLNAQKKARAVAGESDTTLAANFENLQKEMNELDADVQTQLGVESEKWKEVTAASNVDDVSKFISSTKGADDTLSEINKILGKQ